MLKLVVGIFLLLHGVVHVLYIGQSWRVFELQPGMVWPDQSWAFSRVFQPNSLRLLGILTLGIAAVGFMVAGVAVMASQAWWQPLTIATAIFSSVVYLLLWDGKLQALDNQGFVGMLINVIILIAVLVFQWPPLGF